MYNSVLTQKMKGVGLSCQMDTNERQRTANVENKATLSEASNDNYIDDRPTDRTEVKINPNYSK